MILTAEDAPRPVQIVEPPASLAADSPEKINSSTRTFNVTGGEAQDRSSILLLAEEAQNELLRLTDEKNVRNEGDAIVPIHITLEGKLGDPMRRRTHVLEILSRESGYELQIRVDLCVVSKKSFSSGPRPQLSFMNEPCVPRKFM
ncbi:MAG: hypothetical protein HC845_11620 [Akkermansiaceae bacterium]|nr:hypothetical protein [Akkermansiaceae bacterium]